MVFNISNFFDNRGRKSKIGDFQDLDHIDGVSISAVSAGLYKEKRDDLVLFYFRDGASHASVYTQSKIISENLKWNKKIKNKNIYALLVNTRNANALTGINGFKALKEISKNLSQLLSEKQNSDEDSPKKINPNDILFGCTGTIGEKFPLTKIKNSIPNLIQKLKYPQNKLIWMKAAMGIITTDLRPKLSMSEAKIGSSNIKIYGTTFNAISCDGDTSTNDMVSIFSTNKAKNTIIKKSNNPKLKNFNKAVHEVLLNLAKQVASDGEGASKFVTINCKKCKSDKDAKNISFSIANSLLVKTAIAGEDPNWGRIAMAIGKSSGKIDVKKLTILIGPYKIFSSGSLYEKYDEKKVSDYMKNDSIIISVEIGLGNKCFTAYTMDLTKKYIEINADYRT